MTAQPATPTSLHFSSDLSDIDEPEQGHQQQPIVPVEYVEHVEHIEVVQDLRQDGTAPKQGSRSGCKGAGRNTAGRKKATEAVAGTVETAVEPTRTMTRHRR